MGVISNDPLKGVRANEVGNEEIERKNPWIPDISVADIAASKLKQHRFEDDAPALYNNIGKVEQLNANKDGLLGEFGESKYDSPVMFNPNDDKIQNERFEKQSGLAQIGAGLAKGVIIAGTTFVDGIAMMTLGLAKGIHNTQDGDKTTGFLDGLWNNEVTKAMQSINDWAEDTFKNYYSTNQERYTWSKDNILSANFIGDKILKNMGFMLGAYGSGAVLTAGRMLPRAIAGISKNVFKSTGRTMARAAKSTQAIEGSFISAVSEGGIEALNNSTEWKKTQIERLKTEPNK